MVIQSYVICGACAALVVSCSAATRECRTRRWARATTWILSPFGAGRGRHRRRVGQRRAGRCSGAVIILVLTNLSLLVGFPIQSQMVIKGW